MATKHYFCTSPIMAVLAKVKQQKQACATITIPTGMDTCQLFARKLPEAAI